MVVKTVRSALRQWRRAKEPEQPAREIERVQFGIGIQGARSAV